MLQVNINLGGKLIIFSSHYWAQLTADIYTEIMRMRATGLCQGQGVTGGSSRRTGGVMVVLWSAWSVLWRGQMVLHKKRIRWPGFNGPEVVHLSACQSFSLLLCLQISQLSIISYLVSCSHTHTHCPGPSDQYLTSGIDTGLESGWSWSWRWSVIELADLMLDPRSTKRKDPEEDV